MAIIEVACRFCGNTDNVVKHGTGAGGYQRYRCKECKKTFQLSYHYNACKAGIPEKVISMAMNNSGIRDTARVLKIGVSTVLNILKNSSQSMYHQ